MDSRWTLCRFVHRVSEEEASSSLACPTLTIVPQGKHESTFQANSHRPILHKVVLHQAVCRFQNLTLWRRSSIFKVSSLRNVARAAYKETRRHFHCNLVSQKLKHNELGEGMREFNGPEIRINPRQLPGPRKAPLEHLYCHCTNLEARCALKRILLQFDLSCSVEIGVS
jgi:hypothetical protein